MTRTQNSVPQDDSYHSAAYDRPRGARGSLGTGLLPGSEPVHSNSVEMTSKTARKLRKSKPSNTITVTVHDNFNDKASSTGGIGRFSSAHRSRLSHNDKFENVNNLRQHTESDSETRSDDSEDSEPPTSASCLRRFCLSLNKHLAHIAAISSIILFCFNGQLWTYLNQAGSSSPLLSCFLGHIGGLCFFPWVDWGMLGCVDCGSRSKNSGKKKSKRPDDVLSNDGDSVDISNSTTHSLKQPIIKQPGTTSSVHKASSHRTETTTSTKTVSTTKSKSNQPLHPLLIACIYASLFGTFMIAYNYLWFRATFYLPQAQVNAIFLSNVAFSSVFEFIQKRKIDWVRLGGVVLCLCGGALTAVKIGGSFGGSGEVVGTNYSDSGTDINGGAMTMSNAGVTANVEVPESSAEISPKADRPSNPTSGSDSHQLRGCLLAAAAALCTSIYQIGINHSFKDLRRRVQEKKMRESQEALLEDDRMLEDAQAGSSRDRSDNHNSDSRDAESADINDSKDPHSDSADSGVQMTFAFSFLMSATSVVIIVPFIFLIDFLGWEPIELPGMTRREDIMEIPNVNDTQSPTNVNVNYEKNTDLLLSTNSVLHSNLNPDIISEVPGVSVLSDQVTQVSGFSAPVSPAEPISPAILWTLLALACLVAYFVATLQLLVLKMKADPSSMGMVMALTSPMGLLSDWIFRGSEEMWWIQLGGHVLVLTAFGLIYCGGGGRKEEDEGKDEKDGEKKKHIKGSMRKESR